MQWASVSCVSSTFCMAVGPTKSLTPPIPVEPSELWNGNSWGYVSMPVPELPGTLTSVSCVTATFCMAVGYTPAGAFADDWNGSSWSLTTVAAAADGYGLLASVDCLNTTDCQAVGQDGDALTFAEQWNGANWSIVPTQTVSTSPQNGLSSLSCSGPTDCIAVGSQTFQPLAEQFNGSSWSIMPTPDPSNGYGDLISVSCPSSSFCVAAGSTFLSAASGGETPLLESWDGSTWTMDASPVAAVPGLDSLLNAVDCYSTSSCVAVGVGSTAPLAFDYQDGEWMVAQGPSAPAGTTGGAVGAISCLQNWSCVTEGSASSGSSLDVFFAQSTVSDPSLPSALINSPNANQTYSLNQVVPTSFSCFEGTGGPGIASCADSNNSASPGLLDTSTYGQHSYSVSAVSADGLTATASINYWVADSPTATITSPTSDPTYIMNQSVSTSFACAEGSGGPGILRCVDSSGSTSPGLLPTSSPGPNSYSVTATSADGLSTTTSAGYNVIGPPSVRINPPTMATYYSLGQSVIVDPGCFE